MEKFPKPRGVTMSAIIRCLVLCVLVLSPGFILAEDAEEYFQVTTLTPDLLLLSTDQGSYSNNSLVFTGEDGLLLVDTHHDSDAEEFKTFIEGLGFGAPKYIITTHRHVEHIGGNALFGPDPIVVGHHLLPQKLRSGSFLFSEYPPDAFPDITFADSLEINFNGELIRLVDIGGSHDDNEILVHFTKQGIAHVSSVVNGFNFPSVDGDGDVLQFETQVRRLMTLLPKDVGIVSGHHGQASGYDFVGTWDQLPDYADMMKSTIEIVTRQLAEGKTQEEMQEAGIFDHYKQYAGSYVGCADWVEYVVDALTVPKPTGEDIYSPIYKTWKEKGATAAVEHYRDISQSQKEQYDLNEFVLLGIGSKLYSRKLYDDAVDFLVGNAELYPEGQYAYYTHYLAAKGYQELDRKDEALEQCRESLRCQSDFESAAGLLEELSGEKAGK
jgi:cyclase